MIKFISRAAVKDGAFLVRCACDGLLLAEQSGKPVRCDFCNQTITPELVDDTESVCVQDPQSGEWKTYHVQGYSGPRSPHIFQAGDKVRNIRNLHRWQILKIEDGRAVLKMLGNNKNTGAPMQMDVLERAPLGDLRYMPD